MYAEAILIFNGINSAFVQVVLILKKFILVVFNEVDYLKSADIKLMNLFLCLAEFAI